MHVLDFLDPAHEKRAAERRRKERMRSFLAAVVFACVMLVLSSAGVAFFELRRTKIIGMRLVAAVQAMDFEKASKEAAEAERSLDHARIALTLLSPLEYVPYAGPNLAAIRATVESGAPLLEVGSDLFAVVGEVQGEFSHVTSAEGANVGSWQELPAEKKRAVLERIFFAAPRFRKASENLLAAKQRFAKVNMDRLHPKLRAELEPIASALGTLDERALLVARLAEFLPRFLGYPTDQRFLFILQNSEELRPSGGFIGTYGMYTAKNGEFALADIRDVYALDNPAIPLMTQKPPIPMRRYLPAEQWFFRDANWNADFPTTAERLVDFYGRERGAHANELTGVIAITPNVAIRVLELIGCIKIENSMFCPENVVDELEYQVELGFRKDGTPYEQRKEILIPLAHEMEKRLFALPASRYGELIDLFQKSLEEKDIQLWSSGTAIQENVEAFGWDGSLRWKTVDGFMVVDANLGGLKTDPHVKRSIRYTIEKKNDDYIGTVAITYRNTAKQKDWRTGVYRTYTRIHVPVGTTWIETTGSLDNERRYNPHLYEARTDIGIEAGLPTFGTFTAVELGEERTLSFKFRLAPQVVAAIERGTYDLTVLRQAGARPHALTLDLGFDKNIIEATPGEDANDTRESRYLLKTDLRTNQVCTVKMR